MTIKQDGFVHRLNQKGYTKKAAKSITNDVLGTVAEILAEGNGVMFHGFGTFEPVNRSAREVLHVRTGQRSAVAPKCSAKFKAGSLLKRLLNEEKHGEQGADG